MCSPVKPMEWADALIFVDSLFGGGTDGQTIERCSVRAAEHLYLWTNDSFYLERAERCRSYIERLEARVQK